RQVGPRRFLGTIEVEEGLAALLALKRFQKRVCLRHGIGNDFIATCQVARKIHEESEQPNTSEGGRQPRCPPPPRSMVQQFLTLVSAHGHSSIRVRKDLGLSREEYEAPSANCSQRRVGVNTTKATTRTTRKAMA